jgi:hypothetical protein
MVPENEQKPPSEPQGHHIAEVMVGVGADTTGVVVVVVVGAVVTALILA